MMKRILFGISIFSVISIAAIVIFRPEFVNMAIAQYSQFSKYDLARYNIVQPQLQNREQIVRVNNARLVAFDDTDLSFPVSGTIASVFVKEGMTLKKGQRIAALDMKELELDRNKAVQSLAQAQANLVKLQNGSRKEDIAIYESKANLAATTVRAAREDLLTTISSAYTTMDNALRGKFQSIVSVGYNSRPVVEVFIADSNAKSDIIARREAMDPLMDAWKANIAGASIDGDIFSYATIALDSVRTLRDLFDVTGNALNALRSDTTSTTAARATVENLRSGADVTITQITDARAAVKNAEDARQIAENELAFKKAGTGAEDIRSAEALVGESRNALLITEERLSKAVLTAPMDDMVVKKIYLKNKEGVQSGEPVVLLAAHGFKFEADVPEEDIGLVSLNNPVLVVLRSYRDHEIKGEVMSVDEQEVIKNEDTYFRVNIMPSTVQNGLAIRTGMTGEVRIMTGKNKEVYVLPESSVRHDGSKRFILVKNARGIEEMKVTVGATEDGLTQVIGPVATSTAVLVDK